MADIQELRQRFDAAVQPTADGVPTVWVARERVLEVLGWLKPAYPMLYDLTAIDERLREHRDGQPESAFTVVYQLLSFDRNADIRVKVALAEDALSLPTLTSLWPAADWYEREVWDLFGIAFDGHPDLTRILMPEDWEGHPLRKDYPLGGEPVRFSGAE